ncbi:MAG TPA: GldG family protein [Vicinamibacteria bacterium]|nr:GldG family protein [Vicinamibacteria bacterium]
MKRVAVYAGALGAGALLAGVFLFVTQRPREMYWATCLSTGLLGIAFYVVSHWREISTFWGRRAAREGANSGLLVAIVIGILAAVNYISNNHSKQWDLTAAKQHTLSDQSIQTLDELDRDVRIVLLDIPARAVAARDLLDLYDNRSSRVVTEVVDPEAQPERALQFQSPTEPGITLGTVVVEVGEKTERATAATEPEITNAILRALKEERKKIYFVGGHGEKPIDDSEPQSGLSIMNAKLKDSLYDTETLVLARSSVDDRLAVPEDADLIVVAGPRTDFSSEEIEALDAYIRRGGKAVFLLDPSSQGKTDTLVNFLRELGAEIGDDVVIDRFSNPAAYPVVSDYGRHPIVESFRNVRSIFPLVRSVSRPKELPEGVSATELFTTADEESWAETRIDELSARQGPAPDQKRGPLSLALALTLAGEGDGEGEDATEARVVIVGDSDFVANELAQAPILNADLFLNMVNWAAQDEDLMSIRPREPEDRRIFLSAQQRGNVFFLSLLVVPGIVLVTGISVWWGRR